MIFVSKFKRYRITFKGALRKEVGGVQEYIPGIQARFIDGVYDTQDPKMIKLLKGHSQYGITFWSEGVNEPTEEGKRLQEAEQRMVSSLVTGCPKCDFKAANEADLKDHIEKEHPRK